MLTSNISSICCVEKNKSALERKLNFAGVAESDLSFILIGLFLSEKGEKFNDCQKTLPVLFETHVKGI